MEVMDRYVATVRMLEMKGTIRVDQVVPLPIGCQTHQCPICSGTGGDGLCVDVCLRAYVWICTCVCVCVHNPPPK